jgi:hypothetical protein
MGYYHSPVYLESEEHKLEVKVELFVYRVLRTVSSIPRRIFARAFRKKH